MDCWECLKKASLTFEEWGIFLFHLRPRIVASINTFLKMFSAWWAVKTNTGYLGPYSLSLVMQSNFLLKNARLHIFRQ